MTRRFFDLCGKDDRRFSPYCWRARMALAHKGLEAEAIPVAFTDKDKIAHSGQERVPVLEDGDTVVSDSFAIAVYLEEAYPDAPSLFGGPGGQATALFVNSWVDASVHLPLIRVVIGDIFDHIQEKDRDYFRESREPRFGQTIEEMRAGSADALPGFQQALTPARLTFKRQPFLGGDAPLYPDYILFGAFQWARTISPTALLEDGDPVAEWRDRMRALHGGLATSLVGYDG